jgi:hypothetical protein
MGRNCGDHANCYTADGKRKGKLGVEEQCEVSRNETKGGLKMLRKELADMNERLGRMAMGSSSSPRPQTPRPYPGMGMPQDSMMGRPQIGPSGMPMGMRPSYPPQAFGDMDVEIGPYDPSHSMMEPMMMGGQGIPHGMKMGSRRKRGGGRPPGMGGFGRPPLMGTGMPTRGERATGRGPGRRRRPEFADDDMDMRRGAFGDMGMDEDDDWEDLGDGACSPSTHSSGFH